MPGTAQVLITVKYISAYCLWFKGLSLIINPCYILVIIRWTFHIANNSYSLVSSIWLWVNLLGSATTYNNLTIVYYINTLHILLLQWINLIWSTVFRVKTAKNKTLIVLLVQLNSSTFIVLSKFSLSSPTHFSTIYDKFGKWSRGRFFFVCTGFQGKFCLHRGITC